MVLVAADLVSDAVVADINQDVKIGTADGFVDLSFCFAGTETRALAVNQKRILGISGKGNPVAALGELFTELNQICINFFLPFPYCPAELRALTEQPEWNFQVNLN